MIRASFVKGPREGGSENSCGIGGNVRTICKDGRKKEALQNLDLMGQRHTWALSDTYVLFLQQCIHVKNLPQGKLIHAHVIKNGIKPNIFLGNALVSMYVKCRSIEHARQVFDKMPEHNVVSWTAMISGYAQHGYGEEALNLFRQMQHEGVKPDKVTFVSTVKACSCMSAQEQGKWIHAHIIKSGSESNVFVGSALIDMYIKCNNMEHAYQVFKNMPMRNVVSWTAMIAGCVQHGCAEKALTLFWQMQQECVKPNNITFVTLLKACGSLSSLEQGKVIHAHAMEGGFESDIFVGNSLIDMYAKCGSIDHACQTFDKMPERNVVSWNSIITGCSQHGCNDKALKLFWQMQLECLKPNFITFVSVLKACANQGTLEQGKWIHACIIESGSERHVFVGNALIDMYAKCGKIEYALQVFNRMPIRDVVSWNVMIAAYTQHGYGEEALNFFWQMQLKCMKPTNATFVTILKACADLVVLEQGKQIHVCIIQNGSESDVFVGNALIDMYSKCASIQHACQVFDKIPKRDVVSWNVMISGYAQNGHGGEALKLFWQMQQDCMKPDNCTFASALKACASIFSLKHGKQIHACIIDRGFNSDVFLGNTLIDMYGKCGGIEHGRHVFDKMPEQDVISWNAMITGYAQNGHNDEALKLFWQMQQDCVKPNNVTFVSALRACGNLAALQQGKQIHDIIKCEFESDTFVGSTLVDMYAKCGSIEHARQVFDRIPERNVVSWTAMISGYAQHGHGEEALKLYQQMQQECVKPNDITFIGVLSACCHAGLVDEGRCYFYSMHQDHGISPGGEHYACIVDLLGRAGLLLEASDFIKRMPFHPTSVVWIALLGACKVHDHVELAKHAGECILEFEPQHDAAFVLLSNIFAAASRWDDEVKVRELMEDRGVQKSPGYSCIEVNS